MLAVKGKTSSPNCEVVISQSIMVCSALAQHGAKRLDVINRFRRLLDEGNGFIYCIKRLVRVKEEVDHGQLLTQYLPSAKTFTKTVPSSSASISCHSFATRLTGCVSLVITSSRPSLRTTARPA